MEEIKKCLSQLKVEAEVQMKEEEKLGETTTFSYCKGSGQLMGLLTIYVDVGQLPTFKADAYVERLIDRWKPVLERLPEDHGVIFVPVRPGSETRVEYTSLNTSLD